ncbi:hypothetical protein EV421DRAFT_1908901 [Armillaria borealis]|uniref:Ribonuclease H1 N-terminal domain-containing protein n=1 Tax=Armillaria borealis TaxID=47425 RepID=A0AA39J479_9AGAR|nr:hypothetical protein EV421DRAFT_1908901 [Armillaria borealis]
MAQKQLNLSPEAVTVLLEALSVLNLGSASDASTSSSMSAVSPNDANGSASSARACPSVPVGVSAPSALSATSPSSPVVLRSPFIGFPHEVQPVASSSSVTASAQTLTPPSAQVHLGFHCSNCGAFNPAIGQTGETFYMVTVGRQVGVFTNWEIIQPLISGVRHACHKKYRTAAEAEETFETALTEGKVCVL